ncbi:hypothetical protein WFJ45_23970, partial [Salmonella enterica subsp. enterica serovar Minnesota]|uniref:hypothetical protein n=1 Tax=Salmonella enterica TaxID=28901 RepID=UPI003D2BF318
LPLFETLHPWLVPGAALLAPLSDAMADWNGLLNMTLGGIANGVVYAGGDFTSVRPPGSPLGSGEVARNRLAAFSASTGNLITSFNPDVNG